MTSLDAQKPRRVAALLERDLKSLRQLGPLTLLVAPLDCVQADVFWTLRQWLCDPARVRSGEAGRLRLWKGAIFAAAVQTAKRDIAGLVPSLIDLLREVVDLCQQSVAHPQPDTGMQAEALALVPANFLRTTQYSKYQHLARYLKAKRVRAERWRLHPVEDAERAKLVEPHARRAAQAGRAYPAYRLVEEHRVSVFA